MTPLTAGKIPFHTAEQILTAPLTLRADISIGSFTVFTSFFISSQTVNFVPVFDLSIRIDIVRNRTLFEALLKGLNLKVVLCG
jgi:hypothetical protein